MDKYVAPQMDLNAFNCPYCNAFAKMYWYRLENINGVFYNTELAHFNSLYLKSVKCTCCNKFSIWNDTEMLIPSHSTAPMPHKDMPDLIKNDYIEAREILNKSPRGACALLRLTIQKLCDEFVKGNKNLNDKISELVKNGLPQQLQQAFDLVRVVGNNAVHPGELNIDDNPEIALKLFKLINLIIEKMITEPAEINDFYENTIPQDIQKSISDRDFKNKGQING